MKIPKMDGPFLVWSINKNGGLILKQKLYNNMRISIQRGCYDIPTKIPSSLEIEQINMDLFFVPYIENISFKKDDCNGWVVQRVVRPHDERLQDMIEVARTLST